MKAGFKSEYFAELAKLEAANFWFRARNEIILWAMKKYSPQLNSFLEVGCGTGFVLSAIARNFPGTGLVGSEYFGEGLMVARERVPTAEFLQMDARYMPYRCQFDAIGAFDVLEHIEEDGVVMLQMFEALKPGGSLYITVPQHPWLWSRVDEYACHVRRYSAVELHRKICEAGFVIKRSTSFVSILLPAMSLSRVLKRKQGDAKSDEMSELRINRGVNKIFEWMLNVELLIIRVGASLPWGGSRLVVAEKPGTTILDQ